MSVLSVSPSNAYCSEMTERILCKLQVYIILGVSVSSNSGKQYFICVINNTLKEQSTITQSHRNNVVWGVTNNWTTTWTISDFTLVFPAKIVQEIC